MLDSTAFKHVVSLVARLNCVLLFSILSKVEPYDILVIYFVIYLAASPPSYVLDIVLLSLQILYKEAQHRHLVPRLLPHTTHDPRAAVVGTGDQE